MSIAPFDLGGIAPYFDYIYGNFSKPCVVYYQPTIEACNCEDSVSGPTPAWISGGPMTQFDPSCPLCSGRGTITKENFESIKLILEFNPSKFDPVWKSQLTRLPQGVMQAKGFLADLPKVTKCIYLKDDLTQYADRKWSLCETPVSPGKIIQNKYFSSVWSLS